MKKMKKQLIIFAVILALVFGESMTVFAQPVTMPDGTVFDAEYYAESNPDVVAVYGTNANRLYQHYVQYGRAEGRAATAGTENRGTITTPADDIVVTLNGPALSDDMRNILTACSTRATCETDSESAVTRVDSAVNPYDVIYDYGQAYNAYAEAVNWSLVFDANYYKQTFPMLALQYHNDDNLLLLHFRTVGVHEGRQGSANFNVGAYMSNCSETVRNAFGNNYAAYYIYYMMYNNTEKNVNTVTCNNGTATHRQYSVTLTWYQANELAQVNAYRAAAGSAPVSVDPELNAFAMYRGYLNAHDGWKAHDWLTANKANNYVWDLFDTVCSDHNYAIAENTITAKANISCANQLAGELYATSAGHYRNMVNNKCAYIGISGMVWNPVTTSHSQFDFYITNSYIPTLNR